jgi:hypothetical protein
MNKDWFLQAFFYIWYSVAAIATVWVIWILIRLFADKLAGTKSFPNKDHQSTDGYKSIAIYSAISFALIFVISAAIYFFTESWDTTISMFAFIAAWNIASIIRHLFYAYQDKRNYATETHE